MDAAVFRTAAESLNLRLEETQVRAFEDFEEALYRGNEVMNLTRVPKAACFERHFLDSLLLAEWIPEGASVLDLGSGPGFPAWPLAQARRDLRVTALDSSGKMLGFLRSQALPNLEVVEARAEDWGVRERFDFVTGRAVAPLPVFLELAAAPCRVGGEIMPMRTPLEIPEFAQAAEPCAELLYKGFVEKTLPGTDVVRAFPIYRKLKPTPRAFPRRWAEIRKGAR